jgi:hypothetical protein
MNVSMNVSITVNYSTFQTSCVCGLDAQKLLAAWWCFCGQAAVTHRYGQKYSTTVSTSTCCAMHGHAQKLMKLVNVEHLPFFFHFFFKWHIPIIFLTFHVAFSRRPQVYVARSHFGESDERTVQQTWTFEKIWENLRNRRLPRLKSATRIKKKNKKELCICQNHDHIRSSQIISWSYQCQNVPKSEPSETSRCGLADLSNLSTWWFVACLDMFWRRQGGFGWSSEPFESSNPSSVRGQSANHSSNFRELREFHTAELWKCRKNICKTIVKP